MKLLLGLIYLSGFSCKKIQRKIFHLERTSITGADSFFAKGADISRITTIALDAFK